MHTHTHIYIHIHRYLHISAFPSLVKSIHSRCNPGAVKLCDLGVSIHIWLYMCAYIYIHRRFTYKGNTSTHAYIYIHNNPLRNPGAVTLRPRRLDPAIAICIYIHMHSHIYTYMCMYMYLSKYMYMYIYSHPLCHSGAVKLCDLGVSICL